MRRLYGNPKFTTIKSGGRYCPPGPSPFFSAAHLLCSCIKFLLDGLSCKNISCSFRMETIKSSPIRIVIRARVTDIPGKPLDRFYTLGQLFCKQTPKGSFDEDPEHSPHDHAHVPGGFDSDEPLKRYFIYDLNIDQFLDTKDVPYQVFLACKNDDKWYYT